MTPPVVANGKLPAVPQQELYGITEHNDIMQRQDPPAKGAYQCAASPSSHSTPGVNRSVVGGTDGSASKMPSPGRSLTLAPPPGQWQVHYLNTLFRHALQGNLICGLVLEKVPLAARGERSSPAQLTVIDSQSLPQLGAAPLQPHIRRYLKSPSFAKGSYSRFSVAADPIYPTLYALRSVRLDPTLTGVGRSEKSRRSGFLKLERLERNLTVRHQLGLGTAIAKVYYSPAKGKLLMIEELAYSDGRPFLNGCVTPNECLAAAIGIASGIANELDIMHINSWVHRDVKPENMLLCGSSQQPRVKLTDFDFSKQLPLDANSNGVYPNPNRRYLSGACGTPLFMAPEVFGKQVSHKSDVWSLGMSLLCVLMQSQPFDPRDEEIHGAVHCAEPWLAGFARIHAAIKDATPLPQHLAPRPIALSAQLRSAAAKALAQLAAASHAPLSTDARITQEMARNLQHFLTQNAPHPKLTYAAQLVITHMLAPAVEERLATAQLQDQLIAPLIHLHPHWQADWQRLCRFSMGVGQDHFARLSAQARHLAINWQQRQRRPWGQENRRPASR